MLYQPRAPSVRTTVYMPLDDRKMEKMRAFSRWKNTGDENGLRSFQAALRGEYGREIAFIATGIFDNMGPFSVPSIQVKTGDGTFLHVPPEMGYPLRLVKSVSIGALATRLTRSTERNPTLLNLLLELALKGIVMESAPDPITKANLMLVDVPCAPLSETALDHLEMRIRRVIHSRLEAAPEDAREWKKAFLGGLIREEIDDNEADLDLLVVQELIESCFAPTAGQTTGRFLVPPVIAQGELLVQPKRGRAQRMEQSENLHARETTSSSPPS